MGRKATGLIIGFFTRFGRRVARRVSILVDYHKIGSLQVNRELLLALA